jgi:hypothetical protein
VLEAFTTKDIIPCLDKSGSESYQYTVGILRAIYAIYALALYLSDRSGERATTGVLLIEE